MTDSDNTQRVDVARYNPHGYSVGMRAEHEGGYVHWHDYAALLQQLAERDADIEQMRYRLACGKAFGEQCMDDIEALRTRAEAAERAREECVKLAERWERISATHGVRCFTGDDHLIFANELRVALGQQPAAFLAANGGRDE